MRIKITVEHVINTDEFCYDNPPSDPTEWAVRLYEEGYWGEEAVGITHVELYEPTDDNIEMRHQIRIEAAELVAEIDNL